MMLRCTVPAAAAFALVACGERPAMSPADLAGSADDMAMEDRAEAVAAHPSATVEPAQAAPAAPSAPAPNGTPAPGHVALNYLIGKVDPASDPMFARIPEKYLGGTRVWGHKDAVDAFVRMAEAAAVNGYRLKVVSAFRSFDDQKKIWEDKWTGVTRVDGGRLPDTVPDPTARAQKILEYSSMPGTSRHHWGTDFDLNSLNNSYFNTRDGKRIYDWLTGHAADYGFCQVYSVKGEDRPTGYEEEKWHWSYMPVASWYLSQYPVDVGYERLTGFEGADAVRQISVIETYVQAINPQCR